MGQGSYIKTSSGKAAYTPDAHRLLAAEASRLKGMSAATARSGGFSTFDWASLNNGFISQSIPDIVAAMVGAQSNVVNAGTDVWGYKWNTSETTSANSPPPQKYI